MAGVVEQFAEKPGKGALRELLQGSKYSSETQPFEVTSKCCCAAGMLLGLHKDTTVPTMHPLAMACAAPLVTHIQRPLCASMVPYFLETISMVLSRLGLGLDAEFC